MSNHKPKLTKAQQKKIQEFVGRAQQVHVPIGKRGGEVSDFHPVVAAWLTEQGYEHQHHVKLEDFGVVDFIATDKDGKKLLVEAKYGRADIRKAILQVRVYQSQMPDAEAMVICPSNTLREGDQIAAEKHGVKLVTIEIPPITRDPSIPEIIVLYRCAGCGWYMYPENYTSVGMEILEKEGCKISVIELESAHKSPQVQQEPAAQKKHTKKEPKPVHAWPPLPGEKEKYGFS